MTAHRLSPCHVKRSNSAAHAMLRASEGSGEYCLEIFIGELPRTPNGSHGHWRVKAAATKLWRTRVEGLARPFKPESPLSLAKVTCTRFSSHEPDFDNLVSSFKPLVDGLKAAGVIVDDKSAHLEREYLWQKASPRHGRITIRVEAK